MTDDTIPLEFLLGQSGAAYCQPTGSTMPLAAQTTFHPSKRQPGSQPRKQRRGNSPKSSADDDPTNSKETEEQDERGSEKWWEGGGTGNGKDAFLVVSASMPFVVDRGTAPAKEKQRLATKKTAKQRKSVNEVKMILSQGHADLGRKALPPVSAGTVSVDTTNSNNSRRTRTLPRPNHLTFGSEGMPDIAEGLGGATTTQQSQQSGQSTTHMRQSKNINTDSRLSRRILKNKIISLSGLNEITEVASGIEEASLSGFSTITGASGNFPMSPRGRLKPKVQGAQCSGGGFRRSRRKKPGLQGGDSMSVEARKDEPFEISIPTINAPGLPGQCYTGVRQLPEQKVTAPPSNNWGRLAPLMSVDTHDPEDAGSASGWEFSYG